MIGVACNLKYDAENKISSITRFSIKSNSEKK